MNEIMNEFLEHMKEILQSDKIYTIIIRGEYR